MYRKTWKKIKQLIKRYSLYYTGQTSWYNSREQINYSIVRNTKHCQEKKKNSVSTHFSHSSYLRHISLTLKLSSLMEFPHPPRSFEKLLEKNKKYNQLCQMTLRFGLHPSIWLCILISWCLSIFSPFHSSPNYKYILAIKLLPFCSTPYSSDFQHWNFFIPIIPP